MSTASATASRTKRLSQVMDSKGIEAFLCTSGVTMGYLAGFHEEGGERLLTYAIRRDGSSRMICPALSRSQAERCGFEDIRSWKDGEEPLKLVQQLAEDWGLAGKEVAVDDEMRAAILLDLQSALSSTRFCAGQSTLSGLMRTKDAAEISLLKRAGAAADDSLAPVLKKIRPGITEWQVHEWLSEEMRSRDTMPNFCIVATGSHSAEPHHGTSQTQLSKGDVLVMDYGCSVDGYMSDITRTVVIGEPSEEQSKVYDVVFRAHMAARKAIRPGVAAEDIDRAARQVIDDEGYGEFFVHRTGHGLGMRIHEEPYICAGNKHRLEVGNVFSIEPGIYLPGRFGVRIENIVAVTEDGHESMNAEPSPHLTVVPA
ncbi:MAG: aminopeptidase P family protein [Armatimonadetes bacterium]|nr:aminopeptidase P family protein [Armatimonadota bacterium]